jgi:hypothetical protein
VIFSKFEFQGNLEKITGDILTYKVLTDVPIFRLMFSSLSESGYFLQMFCLVRLSILIVGILVVLDGMTSEYACHYNCRCYDTMRADCRIEDCSDPLVTNVKTLYIGGSLCDSHKLRITLTGVSVVLVDEPCGLLPSCT